MLLLVMGGGASGKSGWAETEAVRLAGGGPIYYLATLDPDGPGNDAIIRNHRKRRDGKGFITIEAGSDIDRLPFAENAADATVLLECLSNLLANEMFGGTGSGDSFFTESSRERNIGVPEKTVREVIALSRRVKNLVVVTNLVFSDGITYEKETADYIRNLGTVNTAVLNAADRAVEIVYTCPVELK